MPKLPIEQIVVEERIREDLGNLDDLAESLRQYGLIHPIVVDAQNRLVAGGRRLEAAKRLGWTEIEVRYLGELSELERRMIEIEENVRRKDLTEYERSQRLVELLNAAKAVAKNEAQAVLSNEIVKNTNEAATLDFQHQLSTRGVDNKTSQQGRPFNPESMRSVSRLTRIPEQTFREAKQHVETVQEIPELAEQPKKAVLQVGHMLRKIDDAEQREEVKRAIANNPSLAKLAENPKAFIERVVEHHEEEKQRKIAVLAAKERQIDEAY
ncbi:MAG: ParB N-terminal domain-containing protein, partial [Alicyclobacillus sp.]|nr:ParB N-terminal domain-containing protein [Alicyclobacillus sp.]